MHHPVCSTASTGWHPVFSVGAQAPETHACICTSQSRQSPVCVQHPYNTRDAATRHRLYTKPPSRTHSVSSSLTNAADATLDIRLDSIDRFSTTSTSPRAHERHAATTTGPIPTHIHETVMRGCNEPDRLRKQSWAATVAGYSTGR